jgi:D-alanyl-D-alanine carboxypeptidase
MQLIIKLKYRIGVTIFVLFILMFLNGVCVYADVSNKSYVSVTSPSAVVIDYSSGRILFDKNSSEQRSIASLTKIMTCIMLVEHCNMDELIEVPAVATWQGGSEVGLKRGDKVTARSLLYGMLLPSRERLCIHGGNTPRRDNRKFCKNDE